MTEQCFICYDLFDGKKEASLNPCGHIYHTICIAQWIEYARSCPECRQECRKNQLLPVYFPMETDDSLNATALNDLEDLKVKYIEKCASAGKTRDKVESLRSEASTRKLKVERMMEENAEIERKIEELKTLQDSDIELKHKISKVQKEREELSSEIEDLEIVRQLKTCTNGELKYIIQKIMSVNNSCSEISKSKAAFCLALKQKLTISIDDKEKNSLELDKLKIVYEKDLEKARKQLVVLKKLKEKYLHKKSLQHTEESTKKTTASTSSSNIDSNSDWFLPLDDLEPNNFCIYTNGIKTKTYHINNSSPIIVRVVSSNSIITVENGKDKNLIKNELFNYTLDEHDPSWKLDGMVITPACPGANTFQNLTHSEKLKTIRRKIFKDYIISVPSNTTMELFPLEAPIGEQDPNWTSVGFTLTSKPISIVIEHFPETSESVSSTVNATNIRSKKVVI